MVTEAATSELSKADLFKICTTPSLVQPSLYLYSSQPCLSAKKTYFLFLFLSVGATKPCHGENFQVHLEEGLAHFLNVLHTVHAADNEIR
jgi:hypothetical protein